MMASELPDDEIETLLQRALGLQGDERRFDWQRRLLDRFLVGDIPSAVDLPTGLGKTKVMAIWLVALALGAKLPRRLVYVVDRRVVVDQATREAEELARAVTGSGRLTAGLRLGPAGLPISTLRGQFVDNRRWLEDPSSPAIIVGTVDMVGSRLLFGGYGIGRRMRPYHAGLLGGDTLIVLDEAHLVPPFERLLAQIALDHVADWPRISGSSSGLRVLPLSATGRSRGKGVFELLESEVHGVAAQRVNASKRIRLVPIDDAKALPDRLADTASEVARGGPTTRVIVFCDRREDAQKVASILEKEDKGRAFDVELLVGARRVHERELAYARLVELGFARPLEKRPAAARTKPSILVATSAGEVGADLDAEHMVSDLVAWERMVQRLGRVNRRGEGNAQVVVIVPPHDDKAPPPTVAQRRAAIESLETLDDGARDASPAAINRTRAKFIREIVLATTPAPLYPALTRAVVESWAMTSLDTHAGRPRIAPWLRGWVEEEPQTRILWRRHLPVRPGGPKVKKKEIEAFFDAASPHVSEILEAPTRQVRDWLLSVTSRIQAPEKDLPEAVDKTDVATDLDASASAEEGNEATAPLSARDPAGFLLNPDSDLVRSFSLDELWAALMDSDAALATLADTTLVLDARVGGLDQGLLNAGFTTAAATADDGSDHAWMKQVGFRIRLATDDVPIDDEWREQERFVIASGLDGEEQWLAIDAWGAESKTENGRAVSRAQLLEEHGEWARERAIALADALGLDPPHREALALAARLHDEGKAAARWQDSFRASRHALARMGPLAKTPGPIDQLRLDGYRHELGSYLKACNDSRVNALSPELRELVLHLIVSHHGYARPTISLRGVDDLPPRLLTVHAQEIALRFARLQARWGPWGLAWWEALVRAADQQASRDNERHYGGRA